MFDALAKVLAFFYDVWPSYGGSIVLFTLAIMLVLTPLSIKSTRSMIKMQRVQPQLKQLQAQYKGDREALNREMMAFYQANNINPFSSCLPMILQMPVFWVLYRVLEGLTRGGGGGRTFNPKYLEPSSELFKALRKSTRMDAWGVDLSRSALSVLQHNGVIDALPYFVMIAVVAATAWYQQRQIAGRNPNAVVNPQQQMIGKIVPFIFVPITLSIQAGVVIYFVISNVVRVGQQGLVTKLEFGEGGSQATIVEPTPTTPPPRPAKTGKSGPGRTTPSTAAAARNQSNKKRKRK